MTAPIVIAVVAATPPTMAALLTYFSSRASDRTAQERASAVAQSLENLGVTVARIDACVERVESGVVELRERVARLEGAQGAYAVRDA